MTPSDVVDFWFADGMQRHWFRATPALDTEIRERFAATWRMGANGDLDHWAETPDGALALVILLDQFPLNMYRGQAESFASESKAIAITKATLAQHFDRQLPRDRVAFLYMPLMHSEDLDDQQRAVALYEAAGLDENLRFARHHRDLIRRFGRFPHRNAILGRSSSREELDYLASKDAFTG